MRALTSALRAALAVLLLLLVVGCSDSSDDDGGNDGQAEDSSAKIKVEVGKEFTWNDFTVAQGWELTSRTESISMEDVELTGITGEVTNDADEPRFAVFEFVFVTDDTLQATVRCTSEEVAPDDSQPLECPGFEDVPTDYDLVQVQEITR